MEGESSKGFALNSQPSDASLEDGLIASLLEDCEREGVVLKRSKIINHRGFIFKTCEDLGYGEIGISGQTCRIMEQYLSYVIDVASRIQDKALQRYYYTSKVESRVLLIMACSMQLATKMSAVGGGLKISTLRTMLSVHKYSYTPEQMKQTELDIFVALDHYIPRWTSVDMIEILITLVSDDPRDLATATRLINLAEYNRYTIEMDLLSVVQIEFGAANTRVRTLHLAAGCVAAALKTNHREKDPNPRLASLIRVPCSYIKSICDVVLKETMSNETMIKGNMSKVTISKESMSNRRHMLTNNSVKRKLNFDEEASTSKKKRE